MFIDFYDIMFGLRNGRYVYIGSGSSREVYDLENGYVVKVAKNKAGIEQNRAEYYISANDSSGIFAKVIEASSDYGLLIMRKAKKIKDIRFVWNYFNAGNKHEFYESPHMQRLKNKYKLLLGDFEKASSWGIIKGRPVIIDYGFTRYVERKYYRRFYEEDL